MYAPNGYDDVAALIVRPNPGANFSAVNYEAKAARWKALWPEITVLPADGIRSPDGAQRNPGRVLQVDQGPGWSLRSIRATACSLPTAPRPT